MKSINFPTNARKQSFLRTENFVFECIKKPHSLLWLGFLFHQIFKRKCKYLLKQKKSWHITKNKGWGRAEKKKSFNSWFKKYIDYRNYVYAFWAVKEGEECIYVGRSIAGKTRPQTHFEKYWFNSVTKINIYSTSQRRQIPKLECLAIHRFKPSENNNMPSFSNHDKPCPICKTQKLIKNALKSIFKLR